MRRIASFILAVLCIAMPLSFTVAIGAVADEMSIDILRSDMWQGENVAISNRYVNGGNAISISSDEDTDDFRCLSKFDAIALTDYSELVFSLMVRGSEETYDISITVGSGEYRSDMPVKTVGSQGIHKIYFPISSELAASFDYIEISVQGNDVPIYAMLLDITADNKYTYATLESFGSDDIEIGKGEWSADENGYTVTPDPEGSVSASMSFMSDTSADGAYIVWLDTVSSVAGNISVSAEYKNDEVNVSQDQIMSIGSHSSAFVVDGAFSRVYFDINVPVGGSSEKSIFITGAGVIAVGEGFDIDETLGGVSSCKYENGRVAVSGELSSAAALEYVDSKLGLYVIPLWEGTKGLLEKEPDAVSGFSTLFTLYATPDENYMACMYLPVIVDDGKNIPICAPVMAYSAGQSAVNPQNSAVYAIDGAKPSDAASAGADYEIIDVYTDRLTQSQDVYAASLYNYSGSLYYFNSEYIEEISRRVNFAASVGIRIYARIISGSDGGFDFDPDDKTSIEQLCAVCDYFKTSFSGKIYGYIMGDALNTAELMNSDNIAKTARLAVVFAEALRGSTASTEIYLPFDDREKVNPFAAYAALRYSMARQGLTSVAMLYTCTDDIENALGSVSGTISVANSYGYSTDSSAIIWRAPTDIGSDEAADTYISLCKDANTSGLRFAAIKTENGNIFSEIKKGMAEERIFSAALEAFNATVKNAEPYGAYTVSDLESSYDTSGWIAGGNFDGVTTETSLLKDSRALRTQLKNGSVGMLAYRFDQPVDIGKTDVALSLGVISDTAGTAEITVILGCGETRKEYSAVVECNSPSELICTVADDAAAVEYVAVIVRGSGSGAELYNMSLYSSELSDGEMKDKYSGKQQFTADPLLYAAVIAVAAGTVAIFSALAKKKI